MANPTGSHQGRWAVAELVATVALPTVALIWLTDADRLGPFYGLVAALLPPLAWSVASMIRERQVSALAVIALVSVSLTGGVGLLQLDPRWFAIKEAAVSGLLGLAAAASAPTRFAVLPILLDRVLDPDRVAHALAEAGAEARFEATARRGTVWIGGVLLLSAGLTFVLARVLVHSPTGTEAFADELGWFTALSFPLVGVPATVGMALVLRSVILELEAATGVELEELLRPG